MARKNELHDMVIESLTEALLQIMREKPLSQINVSELCERAGVSRVSYYRNYSSMRDILIKQLTKCTDSWWEVFSQKPMEEFYRTFLSELFAQYRANKKLILLLYQSNTSFILKEHIFACCGSAAERDDENAYSRAVLAGAIYGLVDEWIRRGMGELPDGFSLRKMVLAMPE